MKKTTRILLQTLFAIILLEILLRGLYFQKNANAPHALISAFKSISFRTTDNYKERLLKSHNAVRPDSIGVNQNIVAEIIASNSFQYTPWADYRWDHVIILYSRIHITITQTGRMTNSLTPPATS